MLRSVRTEAGDNHQWDRRKRAGGQPCVYMHGWWKKRLPLMDPSFLLQRQREPSPAEESKYGIITVIML